MQTEIITIDKNNLDLEKIIYAAQAIRQGKLVAFPTETVYGLGANALDTEAVSKIFQAKNRPADNPLIVHITHKNDVTKYAIDVPDIAWTLADVFWPGPLSILLKRTAIIPDIVTAGSSLVSLRVPNHPVALALIKYAQVPIAAPSANSSTRPSPTSAEHVFADLSGKVDIILDAGIVDIGVESTVVDVTSTPPAILRPGGISQEDLRIIIPDIIVSSGNTTAPRAPGMKYKHYAPNSEVKVFTGDKGLVIQKIVDEYNKLYTQNHSVCIITSEILPTIPIGLQQVLSTSEDYAKELFSIFRKAEKDHIEHILVLGITEEGIGLAVMNRLKKAGTHIVVD